MDLIQKRMPEEKRRLAKAMLRAGKMVGEVSRSLEISRATVYRLRHEDDDEDVTALAAAIRNDMADRYLVLADTIIRGIDDLTLARASLREKAIAAAIFTDKAAMLGAFTQPEPIETVVRQAGEGENEEESTCYPLSEGGE